VVQHPQRGHPGDPDPDVSKGQALLPNNIDMGPRSPWGGMLHRGYIMSWNGTIERQLPFNMIGSVGYVATRTIHQLIDRNINTVARPRHHYGEPAAAKLYDARSP